MKRHYRLQAEPGRFELHGSPTRGCLGATYTGRSIDVEGGYPEAKRWLEDYEISSCKSPDLERRLLQSLRLAPKHTFEVPVFRGRFFDDPPDSFEEFGPPPPEKARRGRYNSEGFSVLYLCSSMNGVIRELETARRSRRKLWVQQFHLLPALRMADARELGIESFAAAVFWLIESGRDRSAPPRLGERVGQLIAAEYDGLIVPGVRGGPRELYWNAVIFRPHDCWLQLVDRNAQPFIVVEKNLTSAF